MLDEPCLGAPLQGKLTMSRNQIFAPRRTPVHVLGNGRLHRAIVDLPNGMTEPDRPLQSRIVFFEAPDDAHPSSHLYKVLSAAWCVDAVDLAQRGFITNVQSAQELLHECGFEAPGELGLFVTGAGGAALPAVGPERLHYARTHDVDLFTTPRVATRLQELLATIEDLYLAEPARLANKP